MVSLIATCGRPLLFDRTLSSLEACVQPEQYKGVIVAYNGTDPTWDIAAESYAVPIRVVHSPLARNKSAALNAALASLSENCLVYFHDDDMKLAPKALLAMAEAVSLNGHKGFYGGPVDPEFEQEPDPDFLPYFGRGIRGYDLNLCDCTVLSYPEFLGGNWAAFSDDVMQYGFDERIGPGMSIGGEESLLQSKLRSSLRGVYVPGARASHFVVKEKSTIQWGLNRKYRAGIHYGFFSDNRSRLLREFCKLWYASIGVGCGYLTGSRSQRLGALQSCVYSAGYLRGWLGRVFSRRCSNTSDSLKRKPG